MALNILTVVTNLKRLDHFPKDAHRRQYFWSIYGIPIGTPGRRTYILVHDKLERLPEFVLVRSQLNTRIQYIGVPSFNGTAFCI